MHIMIVGISVTGRDRRIAMQTAVKAKGLEEILRESPALSEKYTYQEYMDGKAAPLNSDDLIEIAYANYRKVKYGQA